MNEKKYAFIGDSNFYRNISYNNLSDIYSIDELKGFFNSIYENELSLSCASYANCTVIIELLSHLADKNDPAYNICKMAIIGMFEHCKDDRGHLKLVADSESTLMQTLFKKVPDDYLKTTEQLSIIVKNIHNTASDEYIGSINSTLNQLKNHVLTMENYFVTDFINYVVKDLNPINPSWKPLINNKLKRKKFLNHLKSPLAYTRIAEAFVIKSAMILGININLNDTQIEKMVDYIKTYYRTPIELFLEVLKRLGTSGIDISKDKNRNFIWDIQIAFSIPDNHKLDNRLPVLITDDTVLLKSAENANLSSQCISFDDYFKIIKMET